MNRLTLSLRKLMFGQPALGVAVVGALVMFAQPSLAQRPNEKAYDAELTKEIEEILARFTRISIGMATRQFREYLLSGPISSAEAYIRINNTALRSVISKDDKLELERSRQMFDELTREDVFGKFFLKSASGRPLVDPDLFYRCTQALSQGLNGVESEKEAAALADYIRSGTANAARRSGITGPEIDALIDRLSAKSGR